MTQEELFEKYRPMFDQLRFGILEHGEGWIGIVDELADNLQRIDPEIYFSLIKEKFGKMDAFIQHDKYSDEAIRFINKANRDSMTVCEQCGRPGEMYTTGYWLKTVCDVCAEAIGNNLEKVVTR